MTSTFIKNIFLNACRDSSPESDSENHEHRRKRSHDNTDHHSKGKPPVFNKPLNKMRIPKILIEESDEVEEQEVLNPQEVIESQTEAEPVVVIPEVQDLPKSHANEVDEMENQKENIEPIQSSSVENAINVEVEVEQGNNNIDSMISANVVTTEEVPCSKTDLVEETEAEENEKREIEKHDLHVPVILADQESDIENTSDIGNVSELYETANDTEYEKKLSAQVESDLGASMESITNKDDEERLQILGRRYELNTSSRESSMPVSDYDFQCRKDSVRSDRRSTLRKQYMLVDSDEDDDTHSLRPVHDDDYFASTESLGIGVSRESLDKTFSHLDLLCGEVIPEKDENVLSRSGSRDDGCDPSKNDDHGLVKLEQSLPNPGIFTECSDTASSESLSSEAEDMDNITMQAKEITEKMDNLSLAWTEEESIENQKMQNEIEKLNDTKPEVPNQIIHSEAVGRLQTKQTEESYVDECKRSLESTKDGISSSYSDRANIVEIDEEELLQKVHRSNKKESLIKENMLKEEETHLNTIDDLSKNHLRTSEDCDRDSPLVRAKLMQRTEEIYDVTDEEFSRMSTVGDESSRYVDEEEMIVPDKHEPKQALPNFLNLPMDKDFKQPADELNILTNVELDDVKYPTPMEDFLMSDSKVSNKKRTRPVILSASSDVSIKEGQCLVLEWEITG